MEHNEMSEEEIDKLLESLKALTQFIGQEEINPEEMLLISENLLKTNEEMIELIKSQNAKWIDVYTNINNSFCKMLIKNLTDKNFITLDELEKAQKEILGNIEKYRKML